MTKEDFIDQMSDIASSGMGELSDWHKEEYTNLFEGMDKKVLIEWLDEFYNQPYGVDEGVMGEELNWVAKYLGKKAKIRFE